MQSQNRLFLALSIGLVALLAIGLVSIGVWTLYRPKPATQPPPATAAPKPTNTPVVIKRTPSPPAAVSPTGEAAGAGGQATPEGGETPPPTLTPTPTQPESTPETGLGLAVMAVVGLGLGGVLVAARRLRSRN